MKKLLLFSLAAGLLLAGSTAHPMEQWSGKEALPSAGIAMAAYLQVAQKIQESQLAPLIGEYEALFKAILQDAKVMTTDINQFINKLRTTYSVALKKLDQEIESSKAYVVPAKFDLFIADRDKLVEQFKHDLARAVLEQCIPNELNRATALLTRIGERLAGEEVNVEDIQQFSLAVQTRLEQVAESIKKILHIPDELAVHPTLVVNLLPLDREYQRIAKKAIVAPVKALVQTIKLHLFNPMYTATNSAFFAHSANAYMLYEELQNMYTKVQAFINDLISKQLLAATDKPKVLNVMLEELKTLSQALVQQGEFYKDSLDGIDADIASELFADAYIKIDLLASLKPSAQIKGELDKRREEIFTEQLTVIKNRFEQEQVDNWSDILFDAQAAMSKLIDLLLNARYGFSTQRFKEKLENAENVSNALQELVLETQGVVSQQFESMIQKGLYDRASYVKNLLTVSCGYSPHVRTNLVSDVEKLAKTMDTLYGILRATNLLIDPAHFDHLMEFGNVTIKDLNAVLQEPSQDLPLRVEPPINKSQSTIKKIRSSRLSKQSAQS